MPRISVVMASYNRIDYIKESVESILSQSFKDFEFIIIDDCSTDGTRELLEKYATLDSRIKLIKNKSNKGLIYNLRLGMDMACGEYIARMDDDDISYPNRFEKQIEYMDKNKDIIVCGTFIELIGDVDNNEGWVKHSSSDEIELLLNFFNPICHPSVIMRKDFLKQNNINFSYDALHAEEYDLWKQIIFKNGKIANLPEVLLKYRIHKKRISQDKSTSKIQNQTAKNVKTEMLARFFNKNDAQSIGKKIIMYPFENNDKYKLFFILKHIYEVDNGVHYSAVTVDKIIKLYCDKKFSLIDERYVYIQKLLSKIYSTKVKLKNNKKYREIKILGIKFKKEFV